MSESTSLVSHLLTPYAIPVVLALFFVLPYLSNSHLRGIPAPFPAAFTNLWLFYQARRGRRFIYVNEAHKKYGKVVRLQPNHVSIADDAAVQTIYGHGNGFLKT